MGQIFACILPLFMRTRVENFSDIRDERPHTPARQIKRKRSRRDAIYRPKGSVPGMVTAADEIEPAPLDHSGVKLTERIPFKVTMELSYVKPDGENPRCCGIRRSSLRSKRKNKIAPRNDELPRTALPHTDKSVVREAWGIQFGNLAQRPRPQEFYTKAFGAKLREMSETPTLVEPTKSKTRWKIKLRRPSLPIFYRKRGEKEQKTEYDIGSPKPEPPQSTRDVVHLASQAQPGNSKNIPRPRDFCRKTIEAIDEQYQTAATATKKEKRKRDLKFRVPTLPLFVRRNSTKSESKIGSNGGNHSVKDEKIEGYTTPKCNEEGLGSDSGHYVTDDGCAFQPMTLSSASSLATTADMQNSETEVKASAATYCGEIPIPTRSGEIPGHTGSGKIPGPAESAEIPGPIGSWKIPSKEMPGPTTSKEMPGPTTSKEMPGPAGHGATTQPPDIQIIDLDEIASSLAAMATTA